MRGFPREQYPDMNVITFTMEDNFNTCNCEHCQALKERYGASIAPLVLFVNEVARRLKAWYELSVPVRCCNYGRFATCRYRLFRRHGFALYSIP